MVSALAALKTLDLTLPSIEGASIAMNALIVSRVFARCLHTRPATLNPWFPNPQPSTFNPKLQTLKPRPSDLKLQPSTHDPQTSTLNPPKVRSRRQLPRTPHPGSQALPEAVPQAPFAAGCLQRQNRLLLLHSESSSSKFECFKLVYRRSDSSWYINCLLEFVRQVGMLNPRPKIRNTIKCKICPRPPRPPQEVSRPGTQATG
jgi:hypothetical protein